MTACYLLLSVVSVRIKEATITHKHTSHGICIRLFVLLALLLLSVGSCASELLVSVLSLLALLSAGSLDLGCLSVSDESVTWLELLHCLGAVVDQTETCALATTELCAEAED